MGKDMTLIDALLNQLAEPVSATADGDWEVGRLVLTRAFRSDVDTLRHCLHLALAYARTNGHVCRLFAACTHVLSRLYRRFGFTTFAQGVSLSGTDKTYSLISGTAEDVSLGLSSRPMHTQ